MWSAEKRAEALEYMHPEPSSNSGRIVGKTEEMPFRGLLPYSPSCAHNAGSVEGDSQMEVVRLFQLGVCSPGLLKDGSICVGVLPQCEEVLIGIALPRRRDPVSAPLNLLDE